MIASWFADCESSRYPSSNSSTQSDDWLCLQAVLFLSLAGFVSPSLVFASHREEAATHLPHSHQAFGGGVQIQGAQTARGLRWTSGPFVATITKVHTTRFPHSEHAKSKLTVFFFANNCFFIFIKRTYFFIHFIIPQHGQELFSEERSHFIDTVTVQQQTAAFAWHVSVDEIAYGQLNGFVFTSVQSYSGLLSSWIKQSTVMSRLSSWLDTPGFGFI